MKVDLEKLKKKAEEIAGEHSLILVVLYGSYSKGKENDRSDIDIAVLGKEELSLSKIIAINTEFADILGEFGIKEIDVKSLHKVSPFFRYQIMKDGVLLYGSSRVFHSLKMYAFRDYNDSKSILALRDVMIKKRMDSLVSK